MALFKKREDEETELFKSNTYVSEEFEGWELKVVELTPNFFVVEASHEDYVTISRQGFDRDTVLQLVEDDVAEVLSRSA